MKCLEKGFGAVRIEAFVSGREKKCVCGGLKKTFSCSKNGIHNLSENAVFVSAERLRRIKVK